MYVTWLPINSQRYIVKSHIFDRVLIRFVTAAAKGGGTRNHKNRFGAGIPVPSEGL